MYEALDLAMEDKSPFPDRSTFIDAGLPSTAREIVAAASEGQSAVVIAADGNSRVIAPAQLSAGVSTGSGV